MLKEMSFPQQFTMQHFEPNFTPAIDLALLSIKHNCPRTSWQNISQQIYSQFGLQIPDEKCKLRYREYQNLMKENRQFEKIQNYIGLGQCQNEPKMPQNFTFVYRNLRKMEKVNRNQDELNLLKQKQLQAIQKYLFPRNARKRNKKINLNSKYTLNNKYTLSSKYTLNSLKLLLAQRIYQRINGNLKKNIFTALIVARQIQSILTKTANKCNSVLAQREQLFAENCIVNGASIAKLMRKHALREQMIEILRIELIEDDPQWSCMSISRIFKNVDMLYNYRQRQQEKQCNEQSIERNYEERQYTDRQHQSQKDRSQLQLRQQLEQIQISRINSVELHDLQEQDILDLEEEEKKLDKIQLQDNNVEMEISYFAQAIDLYPDNKFQIRLQQKSIIGSNQPQKDIGLNQKQQIDPQQNQPLVSQAYKLQVETKQSQSDSNMTAIKKCFTITPAFEEINIPVCNINYQQCKQQEKIEYVDEVKIELKVEEGIDKNIVKIQSSNSQLFKEYPMVKQRQCTIKPRTKISTKNIYKVWIDLSNQ